MPIVNFAIFVLSLLQFWIGGVAEDANITVALAQLYVDGKHQGVHAFIVELRDKNGKIMPGVQIKDNGPKMGYLFVYNEYY